ncbi:MAG: hypothetical protein U0904_01940 [Candidatus Nanopelagicales bacterium]|nr:hypothetical protein [Candidatus Nanopelagicales bacterium]
MTSFSIRKSAVLVAAGALVASGAIIAPAQAYPINDPIISTNKTSYKKNQKIKILVSNVRQGRKVRVRYNRIAFCDGRQVPYYKYKLRYLKRKKANSAGMLRKVIKGKKKRNMKKGIWRITAQVMSKNGKWVVFQNSTLITNKC